MQQRLFVYFVITCLVVPNACIRLTSIAEILETVRDSFAQRKRLSSFDPSVAVVIDKASRTPDNLGDEVWDLITRNHLSRCVEYGCTFAVCSLITLRTTDTRSSNHNGTKHCAIQLISILKVRFALHSKVPEIRTRDGFLRASFQQWFRMHSACQGAQVTPKRTASHVRKG